MTVYVVHYFDDPVCDCCFSSAGVVGAYSNKEAAEKAAETCEHFCYITEVRLDG